MAEFQPRYDEKVTRSLIDSYKQNPKSYSSAFIQSVKNHANYHGVPFYEGEFSVKDALTDLGAGFIEGFTTLHIGDEPDNEYEAIFKNLGHLAGFAPGIIGAPLMGAGKAAAKLGLAGATAQTNSLMAAARIARSLNDKSVPMAAAKVATDFARKNVKPFLKQGRDAKQGAVSTVSNFLLGNKARHIAEGAFHLGTASAVSSWQGGIDQMMSAFVQGGVAGGVFRSIGNYINTGNEAGNKVAKTIAGSLFMGLPSTIQGATTPEQVYQYIMGAWFGGNERPWTVAKAGKFMQKYVKDVESGKMNELKVSMDPAMHPEYKKLPKEVQSVTKEMFTERFGSVEERNQRAWYFAEKAGVDIAEVAERMGPLGSYEEVATSEGKRIRLKEGELGQFNNFIITSGQRGIESFVSREANKRKGTIANIHMVTESQSRGIKKKETPGVITKLSELQLSEANEALAKANNRLKRDQGNLSGEELNLLRKNFFVVKNADEVFLSGEFATYTNPKTKTKTTLNYKLKGAPGWAAQMAIDAKKPVYLYENKQNKWFKYIPSARAFGPETPTMIPKRAGFIAGRYATKQEKDAFRSLLDANFPIEPTKKELKEVERIEIEDKDINEVSDVDVGNPPTTDMSVGKRAFRFVRGHMGKLFEGLAPGIKESKEIETIRQVEKLIPQYTNRGEKENRAFELFDKINEEFKLDLKGTEKDDAKLELRQWVSRRNNDLPLVHLSADGDRIQFMNPDNPVTKAGERKINREPLKLIDSIWQNVFNKEGRAHAVLNEVTVRDKGFRDMNIFRYRNSSRYGQRAFDRMLSRGMKHLAKAENGGYYYYGGKGTDDRLYFMKWHPQTDNIKLTDVSKFFKISDINALRNDFIKSYTNREGMTRNQARDYFDKAFKSNILWNLSINGLTYNRANIEKMMSDGFINTPKAWNKRSQIWFTDSYAGEKEFYADKISDLTPNGDFKYVIINDLSPSDKKLDSRQTKLKSSQLAEHVDGSIIVRDDVLKAMNLDAGTFTGVTQNKSFILSPNGQHGALLGKYMFHAAGDAQSARMKADGQHMYIYESSVKQIGTRKFYTSYDLDPSHVKFNYGVKQDSNMLNPQSLKKQLLNSLVEALAISPTTKNNVRMNDVVEDIFKTLIEPRYHGTKKANEELDVYLSKKDTASDKELAEAVEKLDFENIGLDRLVRATKQANNEMFTRKAYDVMLKMRKKNLTEELEAGELTAEKYKEEISELEDFNSLTTRMLEEGRIAAKEAGVPESSVAMFVHPFVNAYRMKVMSNWIVKQATKPKIDNSGSARIRPYDYGLREDLDGVNPRLKKLDTNDTLFFLDNAYKKMRIKTEIPGYEETTLGKLWSKYESGTFTEGNKVRAEQVFRSAVMRVPMDSISGAQVLKFSGFTGRKGHGILMHSRAMRALGGADLDGDSAYFYMGGRDGFKETWKDAYEANKKEYYSKDKKGNEIVTDNKDPEVAKDLVMEDKRTYNVESSAAVFAPNARMELSNNAVEGRALLGGAAVSPKQVMASAYNIIQERGTDKFTFTNRVWNKFKKKYDYINYEMEVSAKTSDKEKAAIRKLTRAMVGLSSDPMDYAGLKSYEEWWRMMHHAHFNINSMTKNGKKVKNPVEEFDKLPPYVVKGSGVLGMMEKANSAYYSKDYAKNRAYNMDERIEMTRELMMQDPSEINTMTPKIARLLHGIDYSDNALARTNQELVEGLYTNYKETVKQYDFMKKILGRTSFKLPYHKYVESTVKYKLFDSVELDKVVTDPHEFRDAINGTSYAKMPEKADLFNPKKNPRRWYIERVNALRDIRDKAGIFLMNDLTTLNTVKRVKSILDKMTPEELRNVEAIHKSTERLKRDSYLMARARGRLDADLKRTSNRDKLDEIYEALLNDPELSKMNIAPMRKSKTTTSELDQAQIDAEINKLKKSSFTTKNQKDLFDTLMLGSLNRGDLQKIDAFEAKIEKLDPLTHQVLSGLRTEAAKTSMSRLGYNSNAIDPKNLRAMLGDVSQSWLDLSPRRSQKQIEAEAKTLAEEPLTKESIESGLPENFIKEMEGFLVETTGWEGVKKPEKITLDTETKSYINDVIANLKLHNNSVTRDFNFLVRDLLNKDINILNKSDWLFLKNWLDDINRGTIWQRLKNQKITELSKRHYMQFPETINRELMKDEIVLMQKQGIFLTASGDMKMGKVKKATQYMDIIMEWIGQTNDLAISKGDEVTGKLDKEMRFLDDIPDSKALHDVAIAIREHPVIHTINSRKGKSSSVNWADTQSYNDLLQNTLKTTNYETELKNKIYTITKPIEQADGTFVGERVKLKGSEVVKLINDTYTKFFRNMYDIVTGDVPKDKTGKVISPIAESLKKYIVGYYDKENQNPIIDHTTFIRDLKTNWLAGKDIPMNFGVDGVRKIARSMMIEMTGNKEIRNEMKKSYNDVTNRINFENYWPHMHFNRKAAVESLKKYVEHIRNSELPKEEADKILSRMTYRHHALTGDWYFEDMDDWKAFDNILEGISSKRASKEDKIQWFNSIKKAGSMFSREAHLPGWSLDRTVAGGYAKSIVNNYYRQMAQIFSRNSINDFSEAMYKKMGKEQTEAWTNFLKLYVQGAVGNPDVIPEHILNDPKMKIQGTPYAWWADNKVRDRVNKIGKALGLQNKDLPENLRGLDINDVRWWSNLEAKFELASLLAHPKSVVNNIFGGSVHTIQSTGLKTFLEARNPKALVAINPKWTSLKAVDDFVVSQGVLPEFLKSELGLLPQYRASKSKETIDAFAKKITGDPTLSKESILDIAKKGEITKPIGELAAKFMSAPERALRRDAFMAHYLFWYKKFGGAIKEFDHPILVELAKRGVKATQFLYSAPYRPMFARSGLGKIMTRFQLWGWNAVRFRKEAMKQAKLYGFKGEELDRAARLMQLDLLVFGFGNAFAYSMFDTAMPAPWNWLQDTSEWLFGDEKDRNRAFFGQWPRALAPLQTVTPPLLRMPMASIRGFIEDDWSKVSDYYIYTMFPFGRIIKDFIGPNNLIENPLSVVDKWTGVPAIQLNKASKDLRKGPERTVPTPGDFY